MAAAPWPPDSEAALEAALRAGLLVENHLIELKRELGTGTNANAELAADLASLAIDGGVLILGVDEPTSSLNPIPLAGLSERIEQVARSRVDEPLYVRFTAVQSSANPASGYLLVHVPPSPRAPHMVSHNYWGRGDRTKYRLSDAEVERLMQRRAQWSLDATDILREWMGRDPTPTDGRLNPHYFFVGRPVPHRPELLLQVFAGQWPQRFQQLVGRAERKGSNLPPTLQQMTEFVRRPDGWAAHSYPISPTREVEDASSEDRTIELEIAEDGTIRLMSGRAGAPHSAGRFVFEEAPLGHTYQMVALAREISREVGFLGSWDFAVGLNGLRGASSYMIYGLHQSHGPIYTSDEYLQATRCTNEEIEANIGGVVARLLGRFVRALGTEQWREVQAILA